jgi:hypothetical protein
MARASQTYPSMSLVNVAWQTEYVHDPTAWKPLFLWVFGKRVFTGASPFVDTFTVTNPAFDAAADSSPTFYNHSLSFHAFVSDGTNYAGKHSVKDLVCTNFEWAGEADGATTVSFQGTGRTFADSASVVAFADQAGSIMSWNQGVAGANSGIYVDTASPPTTPLVCRNFRVSLSRPHDFHAALGAAAGAEMRTPVPTDLPTGRVHFAMDYEDLTTGTDAPTVASAFAASTAQGVKIRYYVSTSEYIEFACHGSVDPAFINNPSISWGPAGPVGFEFDLDLYPDTISDLRLEMGTSSGT